MESRFIKQRLALAFENPSFADPEALKASRKMFIEAPPWTYDPNYFLNQIKESTEGELSRFFSDGLMDD